MKLDKLIKKFKLDSTKVGFLVLCMEIYEQTQPILSEGFKEKFDTYDQEYFASEISKEKKPGEIFEIIMEETTKYALAKRAEEGRNLSGQKEIN